MQFSLDQYLENEVQRIVCYLKHSSLYMHEIAFFAGLKGNNRFCKVVENAETSLSRRGTKHLSFLQEAEIIIIA
jgi:hypothetical protein